MNYKDINQRSFLILTLTFLFAVSISAQTAAFTYQGKLNTGGTPATGTYEMQFQLFDAAKGGNPIGKAVTDPGVAVASGVFTTTLDFGAAAFDGSTRYLEIGVRAANDPDPFTLLSPRASINSVPYAVRSTNAGTADTATNATQLGGVDAGQYVTTKTGATNFIQNTTNQQAGANLNIDGNGTVGSLNANGPVSMVGIAEPAPAPAGQGRIYFDAATNRVRVSENKGAFIDLVGAGGVSGSGTTDSLPLWSGGTTLGSSLISQSGGTVLLPASVSLAPTASGNNITFGSPNSGTGMTISGPTTRADVRLDAGTLRLAVGQAGVGPPGNGIGIDATGVQLPSAVSLAATASGNNVGFGSPNSETGMTIQGPLGRADLRYDGNLKLLNGPGGIPPAANGIIISQSGNVSVGLYSGNVAKLMVEGGTQYGLAVNNSSPVNNTIRGINSGGGTAVSGLSNNGVGVYGTNGLSGGTGVYAQSQTSAGTALYVDGNARQARSSAGIIKAMALIRVIHTGSNSTSTASVLRCFNSINNSSSGNCGIGFGTVYGNFGVEVNFGFQVNDRFVSITGNSQSGSGGAVTGYPNSNTVEVLDGGGTVEFFIFIY